MMSLLMAVFTRQLIFIFVLLLNFKSNVNADDATPNKELEVTVYYEALCLDSISFISNQLLPSMKNRYNFTDLKFVPYGLTTATPNKKLGVKVYYETLCPDSISFMRRQLLRSMTDKNRFNLTDLKFVPYGHVFVYNDTNTNKKVLSCQHGQTECELNAQHACIIENNSERESFDMITCMMSGYNKPLDKCATKFGINVEAAKMCKETKSTVDILENYGVETNKLNPSFIPAISIQGVFNWDEQDEILKNFDAVFCRRYEQEFNIKLNGCA